MSGGLNTPLGRTLYEQSLVPKVWADNYKVRTYVPPPSGTGSGTYTTPHVSLTGAGTVSPILLPVDQIFALAWARQSWELDMDATCTISSSYTSGHAPTTSTRTSNQEISITSSSITAPFGWGGDNTDTGTYYVGPYWSPGSGVGTHSGAYATPPANAVPSFLDRIRLGYIASGLLYEQSSTSNYLKTTSSATYSDGTTASGSYTGTTTGQTVDPHGTTHVRTTRSGDTTTTKTGGPNAATGLMAVTFGYAPAPGGGSGTFAFMDPANPGYGWLSLVVTLQLAAGLVLNLTSCHNTSIYNGFGSASVPTASGIGVTFDGVSLGNLFYDAAAVPKAIATVTPEVTLTGALTITTSNDPYDDS